MESKPARFTEVVHVHVSRWYCGFCIENNGGLARYFEPFLRMYQKGTALRSTPNFALHVMLTSEYLLTVRGAVIEMAEVVCRQAKKNSHILSGSYSSDTVGTK